MRLFLRRFLTLPLISFLDLLWQFSIFNLGLATTAAFHYYSYFCTTNCDNLIVMFDQNTFQI